MKNYYQTYLRPSFGYQFDILCAKSNICNYNRHYAEHSGYYEGKPKFLAEAKASSKIEFCDSNTGKVLFTAPIGRSMDDFLIESKAHGWPSFRDQETNWENVRVLPDGETVSIDGTHLGHNLPDRHGNRYCISKYSTSFLPWLVVFRPANLFLTAFSNIPPEFKDLVSVAGNKK